MKKVLLILFISIISAVSAHAQNIFGISSAEYYCLTNGKSNTNVGISYSFLKLNVDWFDLDIGHTIMGESVGLFIPQYRKESFSLIPEIALGMANGKFENDESSVRFQSQLGMCLKYDFKSGLSSGICLKYTNIQDCDIMWSLGICLAINL